MVTENLTSCRSSSIPLAVLNSAPPLGVILSGAVGLVQVQEEKRSSGTYHLEEEVRALSRG